ncbi:MAG: hypothetical protein HY226_05855 [Candidatus Vogelbacteria bacterium]|nr:hypothetical protein [Candidatus Vogelbacteria bacterium]
MAWTYLGVGVLVWVLLGGFGIFVSYLTRKIMHSSLKVTEDIVKDGAGNKVTVDYGHRVLRMELLVGPFSFWIASGAMAAALYEYSQGTNFPGKHKLNFWNGDLVVFNWLGPIALLWYVPVATFTLLCRLF